MSIHQSLKLKNKLSRERNVLTRKERLEAMQLQGRWDAEKKDSLFGLPKLRTVKK